MMCTVGTKTILISSWEKLRKSIDCAKDAEKTLRLRPSEDTQHCAALVKIGREALEISLQAIERGLKPFIGDMSVEQYIESTYCEKHMPKRYGLGAGPTVPPIMPDASTSPEAITKIVSKLQEATAICLEQITKGGDA